MFKLIINVASHLPVIGEPVREMVKITALFNEVGTEGYEFPEDFNFLDMMQQAS